MTTWTLEYPSGISSLSLTASLYDNALGDASAVATVSLTEDTNRKGYYRGTSTALTAGSLYWCAISGSVSDSLFCLAPTNGVMKLVPLSAVDWSQVINTTGSMPAVYVSQIGSNVSLQLATRYLNVTGISNPATAIGAYSQGPGLTQGLPTFYNSTGYWIWFNGTNWILSTTVGTNGAAYFQSSGDETGPWTAQGTATGTMAVVNLGLPSTGKNFSQAAQVQLAATQSNYAPAKAGDKMDLVNAPNATAVTAIQNGLMTSGTYTAPNNSGIAAIVGKLPSGPIADETVITGQLTTIGSGITALGSPMQSGNVTVGGYASGQAPPTASAIASASAAAILKTPANLIATNSDGSVNIDSTNVSVNNYITVPASIAQASQTPSQISCLRGDTLAVALPAMGNISTRTKLVMTAKMNANEPDDQAIIQIIEGVGLVVSNGAETSMQSSANLTVIDDVTGAVNLTINAEITAMLSVQDLVWDVQAFLSSGIVTPICGMMSVVADVTRTVT
jgi:hypothetical protein